MYILPYTGMYVQIEQKETTIYSVNDCEATNG